MSPIVKLKLYLFFNPRGYSNMNISIRNKYSLILTAILLFAQATAMPDDQAMAQVYDQMNGALPNKLDYALAKEAETFFNRANCTFGDLACLVQEDALSLKDKEQKSKLLQEITQTRRIIQQLLRELMNCPVKEQLDVTLQIMKAILEDLESSLSSDFANYKAFDIEAFAQKRSLKISEGISDQELKAALDKTQEHFKSIQKRAENVGLTIWNRAYRNSFDKVIQLCAKHDLHWKTFYTLAGCAAFTYVWYQMNTSINGCSATDAGKPEGTDMSPFRSYSPEDPQWKQSLGRLHDWFNGLVRHYLGWSISNEESSGSIRANIKIDDGHSQIVEIMKYYDEAIQQLDGQSKELVAELSKTLEQTGNSSQELLDRFNKMTSLITNPSEKLADAFTKIGEGLLKASKALDRGNKLPQKWLARVDQAGYDIACSRWTPFMTALWIPYHGVFEELYTKVKNKISKKALELHYQLKGGAFYRQYKLNEYEFRINPQCTFDDVIGNEHAKRVLSDVIKYIQDPELYERAGLTPATGYILYGPTRTGKSMIAEALAGELKKAYGGTEDAFPFYSINSHYLSQKHLFEMMLDHFKTKAPCIIFIDEIDLLNLTRTKGQQNTLLSEFLATISGCMNNAPDKKVILIVATNNPDDLDPALLARLPERIPFDYPSFMNRAEYIVRELEGKGLPVDQFDIKKLADQTDGCSYEQVHKVINKAQFTARETGKPVTQLDIEQCINTELRHIIYHDYKTLSEDELNILSLHMVGHAMAYKLIESKGEQLSQVTIRPVKNKVKNSIQSGNGHFDQDCHAIKYGHIFTNRSGDSLKFMSKNDMKRKCMIELAGAVVETIVLENNFLTKQSCSEHDRTEALNWAKKYFLNGMDENTLANSKALQNKIAELSYNFVEECEKEIKALFEPHKDLIIFMADVLKKIETLTSEDLTEMMNIHQNLNGRTLEEYFQDLMQKQQMAVAQAQDAVQDPLSEITIA